MSTTSLPIPLTLRRMRRLPPDPQPTARVAYDPRAGLWLDLATGEPVVRASARGAASSFGETTLTDSGEGTDRNEVVASSFGETTITRTAEGVDSSEGALASTFGETTKTATAEGTDQNEMSEAHELLG